MNASQKRWLQTGLAIVLLAAAALAFWWMAGPGEDTPFVPLFSYELKPNQLQEVEAFLEEKGYEYRVEEGQLKVPEGQLTDILVELAKAGVPSTKGTW